MITLQCNGLTYLSGQRDLLAQAVEAVLQAVPSTAAAILFQPGLGKSTMIRTLMTVFSREFQENTSIAQAIGGVIVVVEKTAEAEELEELCNGFRNQAPVAKAIPGVGRFLWPTQPNTPSCGRAAAYDRGQRAEF